MVMSVSVCVCVCLCVCLLDQRHEMTSVQIERVLPILRARRSVVIMPKQFLL